MAAIVAFPNAAAEPVPSRRRGRLPKTVVSLAAWKNRHGRKAELAREIEERLRAVEILRDAIAQIEAETDGLRLRYERITHGYC